MRRSAGEDVVGQMKEGVDGRGDELEVVLMAAVVDSVVGEKRD